MSDLLSSDFTVRPSGGPVGAEEKNGSRHDTITKCYNIPADVVLVDEVIVLLVLLPYTAVTLTVQLLPALREVMVWVVTDPLTVSDDDRYSSETHNN